MPWSPGIDDFFRFWKAWNLSMEMPAEMPPKEKNQANLVCSENDATLRIYWFLLVRIPEFYGLLFRKKNILMQKVTFFPPGFDPIHLTPSLPASQDHSQKPMEAVQQAADQVKVWGCSWFLLKAVRDHRWNVDISEWVKMNIRYISYIYIHHFSSIILYIPCHEMMASAERYTNAICMWKSHFVKFVGGCLYWWHAIWRWSFGRILWNKLMAYTVFFWHVCADLLVFWITVSCRMQLKDEPCII